MDTSKLRAALLHDEGLRLKPYRDSVGKLTIGVGRNLDDRGITTAEAMVLLDNDITAVVIQLDVHLPWWRNLDDARQQVLANMAFNLGIGGLLGFARTLTAIQTGDYAGAAQDMLASKWAQQVGTRADYLAAMMETGQSA